MANIRAAYAEASVAALDNGSGTGVATSAAMTQGTAGWLDANKNTVIGGTTLGGITVVKGNTVTVTVTESDAHFAVNP